ncbi:MAG: high frequency lysogenization protein HflD [Methylococcales bacterium]
MQLNTITNQTIALAGIAQAAALVQQLATKGSCDPIALETSIASIMKIDSDSVIDVYGSLTGLNLGLTQLNTQMTGYKIVNPEQARYSASLIFLENQLSEHKNLLKIIQTGVIKAQSQSEYFGLLHENVFANLSEVYQNTVSTLQPRIMVNGEQNYLSRTEVSSKIRACLLAGIRSAILWRQCGGTRWKFLFYRKKIQAELQLLLKQI